MRAIFADADRLLVAAWPGGPCSASTAVLASIAWTFVEWANLGDAGAAAVDGRRIDATLAILGADLLAAARPGGIRTASTAVQALGFWAVKNWADCMHRR